MLDMTQIINRYGMSMILQQMIADVESRNTKDEAYLTTLSENLRNTLLEYNRRYDKKVEGREGKGYADE